LTLGALKTGFDSLRAKEYGRLRSGWG
jgi:hypothetical protein